MREDLERRRLTDSWDPGVRILHWFNAILVIVLGLIMLSLEGMKGLGLEDKAVKEGIEQLHAYIGYFLAAGVSLRVLWGFIGNKYARWSDILPLKKEQWQGIGKDIRWYLGGFRGAPVRTPGHDPLASLFYIAAFAVLFSQAATGLLLAGLEFDMFPGSLFTSGLSEHGKEALEEAAEEVHEAGLLFFILFLAAHLGGLVVHELKEKTGLFSSMIHGKKYLHEDEDR